MFIIDFVLVKNGHETHGKVIESFKDLEKSQQRKELIPLTTTVKTMVGMRIAIMILQVVAVSITWLSQWFTDVYLINVPLTFGIFSFMLWTVFQWFNNDWFETTYGMPDQNVDIGQEIDEALSFLSESTLLLKVNCALAAATLLIN